MSRWIHACLALAPVFLFAGCGGGGSSSTTPLSVSSASCSQNTTYDSTVSGTTPSPNSALAYASPTAYTITTRKDATGTAVTVTYMVDTVTSPKGILVMFAGGDGTTGITPTSGPVTGTGNNFLVRSSDLYVNATLGSQNYDVITISRPSDAPATVTSNADYDPYRTSMAAAVDISAIVNTVDPTLPVLFAGTSRGAISAASNSMLSSGIDLSSPVTTGGGTPVGAAGSPSTLQATGIHVPVQITWNTQDGCGASQPANSKALAQTFLDAGLTTTATEIQGGLGNYNGTNYCLAETYHGYFGVESCTVTHELSWADKVLAGLTSSGNTRPTAAAISQSTTGGAVVTLDLSNPSYTSDADGDTLSYAIPYSKSSLGGTLLLSGPTVTYTPPSGVTGTDDTFVYVVSDGKGGTASNVVTVTLN